AGAWRADPGRERKEAAPDGPSGSERRAACVRREMGAAQWIEGRVRQHAVPGGAFDMSEKLSISGGDDAHWMIFTKTVQSGNKLLFRSRTKSPEVQAFATANQMMRVRCVLREDQVAESGMP